VLPLGRKKVYVWAALCALAAIGAWSLPAAASPAATRLVREDVSASVWTRVQPPSFRRRTQSRHLQHRRYRAHRAIVGGNPVLITQAPWQVEIETGIPSKPGKALRCGGSILDSVHILTAAHCVLEPETNIRIPPKEVLVLAGTSNFISPDPTIQISGVTSIRVHPYYSNITGPTSPDPDDVALLELEKPLALSSTPGTTADSIALVPPGSNAPEGTPVNLTGFGRQTPNEPPNGQLYSLGMTVGFSRQCGGEDDALLVCASSPTGSVCKGDSGSGLTSVGSPFTLVGVTDTGEVIAHEPCRNGALGGFANLAAPEIRSFIEGNENPPQAPRGGHASCRLHEPPIVGTSAICQPGIWNNNPTFTYMFVDSKTGQILQSGESPNYQFAPTDMGRVISFEVLASNAGGTGIGRVVFENPIGPAPQTPSLPQAPPTLKLLSRLSLAGANIIVKGTGAQVKLRCEGTATCTGKLVLTAKIASKSKGKKRSRKTRAVKIGTASFSIAAGATATVELGLNGVGRALLKVGHGRLGAQLKIEPESGQPLLKTVRLVQKAHSVRRHKKR
jgi:hypothetical protein